MTSFIIPIHTVSEANRREHWAARAKRVAAHRQITRYLVRTKGCTLPCVVTLTRVAPRALDDDNLRGALKACRDGVADAFRVDDRSPLISWAYAQERGPARSYAVRVEVEPR